MALEGAQIHIPFTSLHSGGGGSSKNTSSRPNPLLDNAATTVPSQPHKLKAVLTGMALVDPPTTVKLPESR